jgi:hypothetical protein
MRTLYNVYSRVKIKRLIMEDIEDFCDVGLT